MLLCNWRNYPTSETRRCIPVFTEIAILMYITKFNTIYKLTSNFSVICFNIILHFPSWYPERIHILKSLLLKFCMYLSPLFWVYLHRLNNQALKRFTDLSCFRLTYFFFIETSCQSIWIDINILSLLLQLLSVAVCRIARQKKETFLEISVYKWPSKFQYTSKLIAIEVLILLCLVLLCLVQGWPFKKKKKQRWFILFCCGLKY